MAVETNEEIKIVLLNLLLKLDEICEKHGLTYYIAYGTCIGALRHKGFIPWDHDIDVLMPIQDAKKLFTYQNELGERYFLQSKETDHEYGSIAFKLRDSETTCIWEEYRNFRFNQGLAIDIYPFYNAPITRVGRLANILRSHLLKVLTLENIRTRRRGAVSLLKSILLRLIQGEKRTKLRNYLKKKLEDVEEGEEILDYYGRDISFLSAISYPKEWFGTPRKIKFEGHLVNAPTNPEAYLTRRYGDYMTIPPKDQQIDDFSLPGVIIDTKKSYRRYYEELDSQSSRV